MAEQNRKIFLPPFLCSFSVVVAGSQSTSRCDFATCVPLLPFVPRFSRYNFGGVNTACSDMCAQRSGRRSPERKRETQSHKSKSNKTFKTNKCQGIFRGGLWRTQRNQYCRKRMYCKSDNKGRINLKARKIFKQTKQEKKTKKKKTEKCNELHEEYIYMVYNPP